MKVSVIVPTYNRPRQLRLCVLSLAEQSLLPYEVMIADDGSTSETKHTVVELQEALRDKFSIKHVWQEDIGFRKPRILNESVRESTGDYLVFIDGDCMAHRNFIRTHVEYSSRMAILGGRRVDIGKEMTEELLAEGAVLNSLTPRLLMNALSFNKNRSRKVEEALTIKSKLLRQLLHRDYMTDDGIWGCNCSLYKDLFVEVNGSDEDFLDGAGEDNDLGIRVLNLGNHIRSVRNLAIVFHLWHPASWSMDSEKALYADKIIARRIANKETFCRNGMRKM